MMKKKPKELVTSDGGDDESEGWMTLNITFSENFVHVRHHYIHDDHSTFACLIKGVRFNGHGLNWTGLRV